MAVKIDITIYGNMGNLLLRETMHKGNYTKNMDVSQLNAGLYFYNISINGSKVSSGKLTILNK
ncbi:MAG: T9SS type A sorting domain-containing protein [Bacteroidota bacterium]